MDFSQESDNFYKSENPVSLFVEGKSPLEADSYRLNEAAIKSLVDKGFKIPGIEIITDKEKSLPKEQVTMYNVTSTISEIEGSVTYTITR